MSRFLVVRCPDVRVNEHVLANATDSHYGAAVTFECELGYALPQNVPRVITCLETAHWSFLPDDIHCLSTCSCWLLAQAAVVRMLHHNVLSALF